MIKKGKIKTLRVNSGFVAVDIGDIYFNEESLENCPFSALKEGMQVEIDGIVKSGKSRPLAQKVRILEKLVIQEVFDQSQSDAESMSQEKLTQNSEINRSPVRNNIRLDDKKPEQPHKIKQSQNSSQKQHTVSQAANNGKQSGVGNERNSGNDFLNPYNFVRYLPPFTKDPVLPEEMLLGRLEPPTHDRMFGLNGKIECYC